MPSYFRKRIDCWLWHKLEQPIRYRIPLVSVGWLLLCCFLVWCLWMLARFFLQLSTGTLLDRWVILGGGVVGVVRYPLKMTTSGCLHCKAQRTGVHGYHSGRWLLWPVKLWGMPSISNPSIFKCCKDQRRGVHGYHSVRWLLPVKLWRMPCIPNPTISLFCSFRFPC